MRRKPLALVISGLTLVAILAMQGTTTAEGDIYGNRMSYAEAIALQAASTDGNRLINGSFDDLGFYPRPTNHYVANMWFEWWADYNTIPEYIDGGHPYHNECYPRPASGECHDNDTQTYNSSQGYIRYRTTPFKAGIYQSVSNVVPCTLYTFEMWNRNDSNAYGARVGIEPTGWVITALGNSPPENCPPDGKSRCPDPYINPNGGFPSTMTWSAASYHPAYIWTKLGVTAEAAADTISVWTYAGAEDGSISQSTYWDNGNLVQVAFPNNKLPAPATWTPSGFVQNIQTSFMTPTLTVAWTTTDPASTQLLYTITSPVMTPTDEMTATLFLPLIQQSERTFYLDTQPVTSHQATITGLGIGDVVKFIALSRRPSGTACATETSLPYEITIGSDQLLALDSSEAAALYAGETTP